jgi:hypothetical protein
MQKFEKGDVVICKCGHLGRCIARIERIGDTDVDLTCYDDVDLTYDATVIKILDCEFVLGGKSMLGRICWPCFDQITDLVNCEEQK